MFERFTEDSRQVIVLAQEEARELRHDYIGTEHLLLGILRVEDGIAAPALAAAGVTLPAARTQLENTLGPGRRTADSSIPFRPRAKKVLELALREAMQLGHDYIGPEHLLLGIVRDGDGMAVQLLAKVGVDLTDLRTRILERIGDRQRESDRSPESRNEPGRPARNLHLMSQLAAVFAENEELHREVEKLRRTLREHGIDPAG